MKLLILAQVSLFSSFFSYTCLAAPAPGKLYGNLPSSKGHVVFQVSPKINNQDYITFDLIHEADFSPIKSEPRYAAGYRAWTGGLDISGIYLEGAKIFPSLSSSSTIKGVYQTNTKAIPDSQIRCRLFNGDTNVGPVFWFGDKVSIPPTANRMMCRAFEISDRNAAQETPVEEDYGVDFSLSEEPVTNKYEPKEVSPTNPYSSNTGRAEEPSYPNIGTSSYDVNSGNDDMFNINPYSVPYNDPNDDSNGNSYDDSNDNLYNDPHDDSFGDPFSDPFDNSNSLSDDYSQY